MIHPCLLAFPYQGGHKKDSSSNTVAGAVMDFNHIPFSPKIGT
jgi:hypothetical protein